MKAISLWDYCAAHAPETIPDWFEHDSPGQPEEPKYGKDVTTNKELIHLIDSWINDPCYDLAALYRDTFSNVAYAITSIDTIRILADRWEKFWKDSSKWEKENKEARYFQWRKYYADEMISIATKNEVLNRD